ncbi:WD40 repeat-like protein [Atractiella rhizophila]|nr:WD40 repeat-like protein [Atractiella rhizophila]
MVRSYERYGPTESFGVIATTSSSTCVHIGKHGFVGGNEDVLVWNLKTGELESMFHAQSHIFPVTAIAVSPALTVQKEHVFAIGYADGSIRIFEWKVGGEMHPPVKMTLNGHGKAVSALAWDADGVRLASGGGEGEIVIWDTLEGIGMFRVHSHRLLITALAFLPLDSKDQTHLLSSSRDTFLKLYHLPTKHCVETTISHRSELLSFTPFSVSGSTYILSDDGKFKKAINLLQSLPSTSNTRISRIEGHPRFPILGVLTAGDKAVEIWRVRTEEEVMRKKKRRKKREKEKAGKKRKGGEAEEEEDEEEEKVMWTDRITLWTTVRASGGGKIKSFTFSSESSGSTSHIHLLLSLASNSLETYTLPYPPPKLPNGESPDALLYSLALPGHRTDVKCLAVSSDDEMLASVSQGSLKVWNIKTTRSIRTIEAGQGIVGAWCKGDGHFLVGTKTGSLELYDIRNSLLVHRVEEAHKGAIWGVDMRPDGRGFVTGGKDGEVRFWEFGKDENGGLVINHTRTMKMQDEILSIKLSPDGRLFAVSLLDSTIKIFFMDTMKFFLSLYGHKLPVLAMDISFDSKLLISCSSDKNIKIWGLDFGDCHRSLFAHDDVINCVRFETNSHLFWSVGRDKLLKQWDGDKFENIQTLHGHNGDVTSLAVSRQGHFVLTASQDRSIRVWERLYDPLFLEEERETELEKLYANADLAAKQRDSSRLQTSLQDDDEVVPEVESGEVQKATAETLTAGERIMEALEVAAKDRSDQNAWEAATNVGESKHREARHPIFASFDNCGPEEYVLNVMRSINQGGLYDALLTLPFDKVIILIDNLNYWAKRQWDIPLVARITQFILRVHYNQLANARSMRPTLLSLRDNVQSAISGERERVGHNLAALRFMQRQLLAAKTVDFFEEMGGMLTEEQALEKLQDNSKKRKRVILKS